MPKVHQNISKNWYRDTGQNLNKENGGPIGTRYPLKVEKILKSMSDRSSFIRAAVLEKLEREGLI